MNAAMRQALYRHGQLNTALDHPSSPRPNAPPHAPEAVPRRYAQSITMDNNEQKGPDARQDRHRSSKHLIGASQLLSHCWTDFYLAQLQSR